MLKETRPNTYHTFRLHYWDWRKEQQTSENSPFTLDRLGERTGISTVRSRFVNSGWSTRCWRPDDNDNDRSICNPNMDTGPLQRCPTIDSEEDPCRFNNERWPTLDEVNNAVGMSSYDGSTYDKFSTVTSGFRNYMEGFKVREDDEIERQNCARDELCRCETGGSTCSCATGSDCEGSQPSQPIDRLIHNTVSQSNINLMHDGNKFHNDSNARH